MLWVLGPIARAAHLHVAGAWGALLASLHALRQARMARNDRSRCQKHGVPSYRLPAVGMGPMITPETPCGAALMPQTRHTALRVGLLHPAKTPGQFVRKVDVENELAPLTEKTAEACARTWSAATWTSRAWPRGAPSRRR